MYAKQMLWIALIFENQLGYSQIKAKLTRTFFPKKFKEIYDFDRTILAYYAIHGIIENAVPNIIKP